MNMKILHISTFDKGGAAKAAIRTHTSLLDCNIESNILFLFAQNADSIKNSFVYKNKEIKPSLTNRILNKLKLIQGKSQQEKNHKLLENKVEGYEMFSFATSDYDFTHLPVYKDADIIHLHWVANFLDYRFFKQNKKPIVWTLHDMNPFTGGCHYSMECYKYKKKCSECIQLSGTIDTNNAYYNLKFKKKMLPTKHIEIVTPSNWLALHSQKSNLFKKYSHTTIPNTLDLTIYTRLNKDDCRQKLNLPLNVPILLFVSENIQNHRKGFAHLINSIGDLQIPNLQLACVGKFPENIDFMENLHFLGEIHDERMMAIAYNAADVFILPSEEDNLPNVILESLCTGTPVIAFPNSGAKEIIQNGINGMITDEISSNSLSNAISTFFLSKEKYNNINISTEAHVRFSREKHNNAYLNIYKKLVNSNTG